MSSTLIGPDTSDSGSEPRIVPGLIPKYHQLLQILRNQILSSDLPPGAKLPSEEDLIQSYGLSRGTVRKAIAQLEAERLIRTEHGVGSFVLSMHPRAIPIRFAARPRAFGPETSHRVLAQEVVPARADVAERLRLAPGTPVIHIARLRVSGDEVLAYTVRYLPEELCPSLLDEDLSSVSVHNLLVTRSELPLLRIEVTIEGRSLTKEDADLLNLQANAPAIFVERMTYTAPNRPAVWYRGLFKNDYHLGVSTG